jgi:methionyl-tRNA synthetase
MANIIYNAPFTIVFQLLICWFTAPHIGHLYSAVIADATQRFQQLTKGGLTLLSSGTDEHGSKVKTAAGSSNTLTYCDSLSFEYKTMLELYDVECTKFVRTTSHEHKEAVHAFWVCIFIIQFSINNLRPYVML